MGRSAALATAVQRVARFVLAVACPCDSLSKLPVQAGASTQHLHR